MRPATLEAQERNREAQIFEAWMAMTVKLGWNWKANTAVDRPVEKKGLQA